MREDPSKPRSGTSPAIAPIVPPALGGIGFGGAAIGNLYTEVADEAAEAAVRFAFEQGIRYFDTAPYYGYGLGEERIGRALSEFAEGDVRISTKVGRLISEAGGGPQPDDGFAVPGRCARFDYSRDGVLRSLESSLRRLRRQRVDTVLVHDVGRETHGERHDVVLRQVLDEALPALCDLRSTGGCRAIGIGVNEIEVCLELLARADLDVILLAGRYTLLENGAALDLLAEARRRGVEVIIGGPYNSGLLAAADRPGATYNYRAVDASVLARAQRIYDACAAHGVDVGAAALQFPLAHPAVKSVIIGMRTTDEVRAACDRILARIAPALWGALQGAGVIHSAAPTP
jgi:D-threo-aldose 1-dehydrogenase